jgi:hypothetical protein
MNGAPVKLDYVQSLLGILNSFNFTCLKLFKVKVLMSLEIKEGIQQFIAMLFKSPSQPPFSFHIDFGSQSPDDGLLLSILVYGAEARYSKQLHELSPAELQTLREYMLSIGWDADYNMIKDDKEVVDYHPDGRAYVRVLKLNTWQITFKPADPSLSLNGGAAGCGTNMI